MTPTQIEAEALFDRYLKAWNAHDLPAIAACFAEPAMFILPAGPVTVADRPALVVLLKKVFADLSAAGYSRSTVGPIKARRCGDGIAIVDALDVRRLKQDGSILEEIDGHYVMQRTAEGWRFAVGVVCEGGWQGS